VDLYVGLLGGRFGTGITEAEYRAARQAGLPCFFYVKREFGIAAHQREKSAEGLARLKAFRDEVADPLTGHLAQEFSGPDDLASEVAAHAGEFGLVRQIHQRLATFTSIARSEGAPTASSLLDSLLALAGPAVGERLLQGVEKLGTDYKVRIQNFLDSYLGTSDHPVTFGGRETELARIDEWLDSSDAEPYPLLQEAPEAESQRYWCTGAGG
jgi:hypothetical protein